MGPIGSILVQIYSSWSKLVFIGPNRSKKERLKIIKYTNQDQVGHGLNHWSFLYGICIEKKYRFKIHCQIFLHLEMLSIKKNYISGSIGIGLCTFLGPKVVVLTLFV